MSGGGNNPNAGQNQRPLPVFNPQGPIAQQTGNNPNVNTGIPQGGYAAQNINAYLQPGPARYLQGGVNSDYVTPGQQTQGRSIDQLINLAGMNSEIEQVQAADQILAEQGYERDEQGNPVFTGKTPEWQTNIRNKTGDFYEDKIKGTWVDPQPKTKETAWGSDFVVSPGTAVAGPVGMANPLLGAAIGIGGSVAKSNMDRIHEKHGMYGQGDNTGLGIIKENTIDGVSTPLAISQGFGGGTVISGNTDLAIQQNPGLDLNGDGDLTPTELSDYMAAEKAAKNIAQLEAQAAQNPEATAMIKQIEAENPALEQVRQQEEIKANKQKATMDRLQYEQDLQARIAQHDGGDSGHTGGYVGGTVVTGKDGKAVTDSSGKAATAGGTWVSTTQKSPTPKPAPSNNDDSGSDDSGGGGGGCCFIMLEARYGDGTMDNVVRKYRDEFMTERNRRGYYKVAEVLVPLMRHSKVFKWFVTKLFADPLVAYGKYYYKFNRYGVIFKPFVNFWLSIFDIVGGDTKFIRENGETV